MAVGSIVWKLLMDTAGFETDSKKAAKHLKEIKAESAELTEKMSGLTEAFLGVGLSIAGVTAAFAETINKMDEYSKAAKTIGTSTEAYSELAYAAQFADVSAEDLKDAMVKMSRAAADNDPAFAAMGISIKDANGHLKDNGVLFTEVADKMSGYRDGAGKVALAQDVFGKSGANMINLLNSGKDGLKAFADEARATGNVISSEAGEQAEQFNDTLTKLKLMMGGELQRAATELLPTLQQIASAFADGGEKANKAAGSYDWLKTIIKGLTSVAVGVATAFKLVGNQVAGGLNAWRILLGIDTDLKGLDRIKGAWQAIGSTWKDTGDLAAEAGATIEKIWANTADGVGKEADKAGEKTQQAFAPDVNKLKAQLDAAAAAHKKWLAEVAAAQKKMMQEGQELRNSLATPAEAKLNTEGNARKLLVVGAIDDETYKKALAKAQDDYDKAMQAQEDLLTAGLLSEEAQIKQSYERRKKEILNSSLSTEQEKQDAIANLTAKQEADIQAAQYNRYKDLMTAEEVATQDYINRKQKIYDDDTLTQEQRTQYLGKLNEDYHAQMQTLDDADQAKKDAANKAQIDMMSQGFSGMADLAKAFAGEQSGTYQALFAASKAFAIADITIKQSQAIAKAWGENNYFTAIGLTVGLAAQFAGLLSSTQSASFGGTRADGGSVKEGRRYLVGERGPEMFTAPSNGSIVTNADLQPQTAQNNIRIVNAYDDGHIDNYLGSDNGEEKIVNAVRRNKRALGLTS